MRSKTLTEQIKEHDGSVKKAADKFGVTRQTMYKYIDYFDNGEIGKIPEKVVLHFQKLEIKDGPISIEEMSIIATLRERGDLREEQRAIKYMIRLVKDEIKENEEKIREYDFDENEFLKPPELEAQRVEWVQSLKEDNDKLNAYLGELNQELERIKQKKLTTSFFDKSDESVDEKLKRLVERGGYGGPSWKGKDFGVISVCQNGEYMVIVDEIGLDARDVQLFLYAIIGGSRVHIATYDFPNQNEKFIRFNLVPKLPYYYEVKSSSLDHDYTSGILELTNDV